MQRTDINLMKSITLSELINGGYKLNFHEFIEQIQLANKPISLASIRFILDHVELTKEEIKSLASFDKETYSRQRLFKSEHCEVLILSWLNGQRSKIHDHLNTSCGVKILHGEATETVFEKAANGHIFASQSTQYQEGNVTVSKDNDIHQISNLQADDEPLITLHVYSPPLDQFYTYQIESGKSELLDTQQECWVYEI
ncbi:cysteine dioxygenase [Vibrio campbellii]|nr:cysteine dioxygenase family protein [Vibrio campbellii]